MFKDAVSTNESIQDNREQATMRVATLDVSKLVDSSKTGKPWDSDQI